MEPDRNTVEVASWRLASDLLSRHPGAARLLIGHPGGGQYDVLWIIGRGDGREVRLNRAGTIQVWHDGDPLEGWGPVAWGDYLAGDHQRFVQELETALGWDSPARRRPATPETLTYAVIAAVAATAAGQGSGVRVEQGFIDTSGEGGGRNRLLDLFPIPTVLLAPGGDDLLGEPGYRFWIITVDDVPAVAFEQSTALAFLPGDAPPIDLRQTYKTAGNRVQPVARLLLARGER